MSNTKDVKRVLLFGRTGEGKSTIANVLVTGGIEEVVFKSSDSARGCTTDIKTETGRGWKVTDTLGVGEASDVGTVSTEAAKAKLTDFLRNVRDSYSHIIYVQKGARRLTQLDEAIWELFAEIFQGAERAFVVLFTCQSEQWLRDNRDRLPLYMKNHQILVTDIPPVNKRPVGERRDKARREKSIARLEQELERIFEENKRQFVKPEIAGMTEQQLVEKTESIWKAMIRRIRSLFDEDKLELFARQFSTLVDAVGSFRRPSGRF